MILQGMGNSLAQGIKIPVVISLPGMIFSLIVAMGISILSAWIPAYRASKMPIKDVIFGTVEEKHIPKPVIILIGVIVFIISSLLPRLVKGKILYLAGGLSLLGLIVATILLIPILANLASFVLETVYGKVLGNK